MNPLTQTRNINKLNEREAQLGVKSSWHNQYKDSAWVFIGGLPYDLTEGDVIAVFSQYGEILQLHLVRDKFTGKQKGYGFICFEDQRSTILSVDNLNGIKLCNRTIRVDHMANYRPPKDDQSLDELTKILRAEGCGPEVAQKLIPSKPELASDLPDIKPLLDKSLLKKIKKDKKKSEDHKEKRKLKLLKSAIKKIKKVENKQLKEAECSDSSSSTTDQSPVLKKKKIEDREAYRVKSRDTKASSASNHKAKDRFKEDERAGYRRDEPLKHHRADRPKSKSREGDKHRSKKRRSRSRSHERVHRHS